MDAETLHGVAKHFIQRFLNVMFVWVCPVTAIHPDPIDSNFLQGVALRYYQVDAVNEALKVGHGIMVLATAAGKTYINAALVKAYEPFRSLTIVPNADLVRQTAASFGANSRSRFHRSRIARHRVPVVTLHPAVIACDQHATHAMTCTDVAANEAEAVTVDPTGLLRGHLRTIGACDS